MKIKKVSQSAGIIAEIEQNLDSNSEVNAPSVRAVKNALSYSTEEQVIGTWINGKPLYRKVFTVDTLPNAEAITIDTNLSNAEAIRLYGATTGGSGNVFPLPFVGLYTENTSMEIVWLNENKQIRITTQSDRSSYGAYFVLEYTKTTD